MKWIILIKLIIFKTCRLMLNRYKNKMKKIYLENNHCSSRPTTNKINIYQKKCSCNLLLLCSYYRENSNLLLEHWFSKCHCYLEFRIKNFMGIEIHYENFL